MDRRSSRKAIRAEACLSSLTGEVKVVSFSSLGKNAVFNVLGVGDIFGEIALLDGGERTADVTALTDCKLMVIERRDFLPLVRSRTGYRSEADRNSLRPLRNTSRQVEESHVSRSRGPVGTGRFRLRPADHKSGSFRLALTQSDIAPIIGASRESTNKQLREWEDNKWVRLRAGCSDRSVAGRTLVAR